MTKKILLADDSITIQKVVRITLADGDYNLITVDNGSEAIDRLKAEMPDLVLADVVMPGKDGYQVCEEIKKNPSLSSIPVILLAGSFEGFDEIKGAEVGADGYIIKPFESQTLISKVEEMLSRPKAKPKKVEEQPVARPTPAPTAAAPAPQAPAQVDSEVKDFMDTLSAEMDQPKAPEAPAAEPIAEAAPAAEEPAEQPQAEPIAAAEPVAEAEPIYGAAEPVAEAAAEPIQEAAMVSEEQLWEAEPVEGEPAPGETVMEAEPVSEEALWAEPVAEEAAAAGEPVMEAEMETTQPIVAEPEVPAEAEIAAEPAIEQPVAEAEPVAEAAPTAEVTTEPVSEWTPESELPAEPVELGTPGEEPVYGEAKIEEAPIAAEPEAISAPPAEEAATEPAASEERPDVGAVMEQMPSDEPMPEVGVEAPSAVVHARVAEAAEEIATAAASGLSRSELVELIRATVEKVAWEVVPEMAEALIKERITRWEVQTQ